MKKHWNAKEKNCSNGCDKKHICVVCVCDDCGTCDLETMKCGCKLAWEIEFDEIPHGGALSLNGDYVSVLNAKRFISSQIEKAREEERERINQYFANKASYDTDTDETIISDRTYHTAFNPNGCGNRDCPYCRTITPPNEE